MGSRSYDGGNAFWITWGIIAGGLFIGFLCAQEGDAGRLDVLPGDATPEQVEESVDDLEALMLDAGFEPEQIEPVLLRYRCKYLPEECDEASQR